jgi:Tol biopolymer transport system component
VAAGLLWLGLPGSGNQLLLGSLGSGAAQPEARAHIPATGNPLFDSLGSSAGQLEARADIHAGGKHQWFGTLGSSAAQTEASPQILAVGGRQVVWLNFEAPRDRPVSHLPGSSNALEVTAMPDASHVVTAVGWPFADSGAHGADLLNLDLQTGEVTPLLQRADPHESLDSPAWWPDRATLLFERQDLSGQPVGAPGQEVPRYPSRIERVMSDGSGRGIVLDEGRQPSAAPDGTRLVYARTRNQGAALLIWSPLDGSIQTLVPEGRFADVAYPQVSPASDQVAFVAPQSGLNGSPEQPLFGLGGSRERPLLALDALFGPAVAYAHGIPWDPWLVNLDGSGLHRVAETGADEPSVAWSPDARSLFVYSGTGSYIVDAQSGEVTPYAFVKGYGPTVWLASAS